MTLHEILRDITKHLPIPAEKIREDILAKIDAHEQETTAAAEPVDEQPDADAQVGGQQ
ncbi:hypothetical protein [Amycolatopsis alkalitolerans]|uniref:hypothetical protein n=1 Tax=Amycolatopsis alkalitolerans TaxID=2547244 RepID=UPI00135AF494|nr:hypothetical protein [Amycolatopsis alkalitolerans]